MLPRSNRLPRTNITLVKKTGRLGSGKLLGIIYLKNNLEVSRIGIVVSTKISKKAVVRNKIKRQIRKYFSDNLKKHHITYDILVLAKTGIVSKEYADISNDLNMLVEKLFSRH